MEPTLEDIFGAGTTQTATTISIPKANLTGLTVLAVNTGEQLAAGLALRMEQGLKETTFSTNINQNIYVTRGSNFNTFRGENNTNYTVRQLIFNFSELDEGDIDPDKY